ncbi:NUDIX hydrolase [Pelotomaculum propionicicum]|uniref:Methanol dehydrogenase activator n=1 Tax=Pelotomaculum propionicicum TaxID=258475 RepID=A0A4Y7RU93_9FIRM|nr:NUDIX hydrolase [Pelotomaculum propionicicum]NLI14351.1 NUDIX hydrolase [Peptococcaceae bacterium]TEB12558.1 Methanol dehydrogenase activator [Pelotomaculum propionicicum]
MLSTKRVYEGRIINLRVDTVALQDGHTSTREVVEYAGAVAIVAVNEKDELLLVRQFRYAVGQTLLELPAGKVEPGEDYAASAGRELLEETGYEAKKIEPLITFYTTPGFTNEKIEVFTASDLTLKNQNLDDDEFIDVEPVSFEKVLDMIAKGEICDAKSTAGILAYYYLKRQAGL